MISNRIAELTRVFADSPGYLLDTGWLRSMESREPVDRDGRPIPWITYPALDFLGGRLDPAMAVFEYGSGNSTLWWGSRVARVVSCEHDKEWFAGFSGRITGPHVTYLLRRCKGGSTDYVEEISRYPGMFDILVIDGRERVGCAENGLASLRPGGVILWDNGDRDEYRPGYDMLRQAGFKRLDFWGLGPLSTRRWCTSVFYQDHNCLRI